MNVTQKLLLGVTATIIIAANANAGRWLSRDPIQEGAGFVQRDPMPEFEPILEPRNEPYLYVFVGNDAINSIDPFGLWMIDRNGGAKAPAQAEAGDTIADLANIIGLSAAEYQRWLTPASGTTMPSSSSQRLGGCEKFEIPNTVVAYWAGNLGWFGRAWVRWNSSAKYLRARGFNVDEQRHQKGNTWALERVFISKSVGKEIHGLYFWGHGGRFGPPGSPPYPAQVLFSDSGDPVLEFANPGLYYHMGLGLVFACDSNSGKSALMSGNSSQIWKGFDGTLVPWPFRAYHAKHYIRPGQQATH